MPSPDELSKQAAPLTPEQQQILNEIPRVEDQAQQASQDLMQKLQKLSEEPTDVRASAPDPCVEPCIDPIIEDKTWRRDLDAILQQVKWRPSSRERSLCITKLQEAIMWLGMDLKRLAPFAPKPDRLEEAKAAYLRYGAVTGFKNFQGNPMPAFEDLPLNIKEAWAQAIETRTPASGCTNPYPHSYDPSSTRVEPTADGLKL